MVLSIQEGGLLEKRRLKVDSAGIEILVCTLWTRRTRVAFRDVDYVLMSADGVLSLQYGREVFSIRTKPQKAGHKQVVDTLLQCVRSSSRGAVGGRAEGAGQP